MSNPSTSCCVGSPSRHLVIIGGGSAAFAAATRAAEHGWRVTIANHGLPIGGTCVNVGCVPSKALIRAAETRHRAMTHGFDGVVTHTGPTDFGRLARQTAQVVETLRRKKYRDIGADLDGVEIIEAPARLSGPREIEVDGRSLTADRVLIATGARTAVPDVPGLAESGYLIPDTAFSLDELPESLIVIGGRYIALECAQMFARLGTRVTLLQRSSRILPSESVQLTDSLGNVLQREGVDLHTGAHLLRVRREASAVTVEAEVEGKPVTLSAARLLLATGRTPNTRGFGLEETGIMLDKDGFVVVNDRLETSVPGIHAAGDVIGHPMFVYTAAYEGALAADNACGRPSRRRDYEPLPWVVFTDPQVAGVGLDETAARAAGWDAESVTLPMAQVPRCIVSRQTDGFLQLIRDRRSDRLLGARALAHEGSELMMEMSLALRHRMTASQLAAMFHPYLTLGEAVKLAALSFGKDVTKLSCCAT